MLSEGNGFIYLIQGSHLLLDLIQLSTYSSAVEIATSDHLSPLMEWVFLSLTYSRRTKENEVTWPRPRREKRMQWSEKVAVYVSQILAQSMVFLYPRGSSAPLHGLTTGNCLSGELTQLLHVSWEGALLSSVVPSPPSCCAVLRDLELHICFLLCMHKPWGLYPICVAAGLRDENLIHLRYANEFHWCKISITQVGNVISWDFPLKYSPNPLQWQQSH